MGSIQQQSGLKKGMHRQELRLQVYEELKAWDKRRAEALKKHLKTVEDIKSAINIKIEDSKDFVASLQAILQQRINQLKLYIRNSAINSDLVLEKNKAEAYDPHFSILKGLFMGEAQQTAQQSDRLSQLSKIYGELTGLQEDEEDERLGGSQIHEESSILMRKGSVEYLIECELSQIVETVVELGRRVSEVFGSKNSQDLYLAINEFVGMTHRQTQKHRQIGRELVSFVSASIRREVKMQSKVRNCLKEWADIDGPVPEVFCQQLNKTDINALVAHFYDINQLSPLSIQENFVEEFLINFEAQEFGAHQKLVLCEMEGFYEMKTAAVIVVTADLFVHFFRMNKSAPDFTFHLNSDLHIKREKEFILSFTQFKKKFYFKKEKEFGFQVEFNSQEDLLHFRSIVEKVSPCHVE